MTPALQPIWGTLGRRLSHKFFARRCEAHPVESLRLPQYTIGGGHLEGKSRTMHSLKQFPSYPARIALGLLLGACLWPGANGNLRAIGTSDKVTDLTGLSLEQLYNLDVVQVNVLGGHTHPVGQIMFGYQYMFTDMQGIK